MISYKEAVGQRGFVRKWKKVTFWALLFMSLFGAATLYLAAKLWSELANRSAGSMVVSQIASIERKLEPFWNEP